jgi:triphosphatase
VGPAQGGFETELKFQVPAAARAAVRQAVATASAQRTRLRALYVDTADHRLAAAGFALRLRQEDTAWVQTLKGRGDGLARRLEDEVRLEAQRGEPKLDPQRHAGTPAGRALLALLEDGAALEVIYRTDIERIHRRVRHQGATIELAHDRGHIVAGRRRVAIDELEFELLAGPPAALVGVAARWAERHGLWWDPRTKSERGFRLATGAVQVPPVRAAATALPDGASLQAIRQAALAAALAHALPNAAEIAAGTAAPEHLHQLRVALRRLRTALDLMAPWGADEAASHALQARWAAVFAALGAARDADVIEETWAPALRAAGAPALAASAHADVVPPAEVVRGAAFTGAALLTLAEVLATVPAAQTEDPDPRSAAAALLQTLWRRAWADARVFGDTATDSARRHRARKRLKRLRYALEFLAPLFAEKAVRRFSKRLGRALEALGTVNDLQVAHDHYRAAAAADPAAWFAVGWLAAR